MVSVSFLFLFLLTPVFAAFLNPPLTVSSPRVCPTLVKAVIQQTLPVLRDIVDSISSESTKSRQICYQSLQESVQVTLNLFPVFIQQPGQLAICSLFLYLQFKLDL